MRLINDEDILMHYDIPDNVLMNYYSLSKPEYDAYIAHYGVQGMKWGFIDGVRQAGKRIAEEGLNVLNYDYQKRKLNRNINTANAANMQARKNVNAANRERENYLNTGLNRSFASGSDSTFKNVVKANNAYTNTQKKLKEAQAASAAFDNSTYGKTLKGIKNARNAVSTTLSTIKNSKAYQKGTALGKSVVNKIGSVSSSLLSKAKSKGLQTYAKIFGTKYSSPAGPTLNKQQQAEIQRRQTASSIRKSASNLYNSAKSKVKQGVSAINNAYDNAKSTAKNAVSTAKNAYNTAKSTAKNAKSTAKNLFSNAKSTLSNAKNGIAEAIRRRYYK